MIDNLNWQDLRCLEAAVGGRLAACLVEGENRFTGHWVVFVNFIYIYIYEKILKILLKKIKITNF